MASFHDVNGMAQQRWGGGGGEGSIGQSGIFISEVWRPFFWEVKIIYNPMQSLY